MLDSRRPTTTLLRRGALVQPAHGRPANRLRLPRGLPVRLGGTRQLCAVHGGRARRRRRGHDRDLRPARAPVSRARRGGRRTAADGVRFEFVPEPERRRPRIGTACCTCGALAPTPRSCACPGRRAGPGRVSRLPRRGMRRGAVRPDLDRLRNTLVCVRAYTTSEMCAVLDGHLPDDRDARHLHEVERFALRHAHRFLWPGGGVLAAYHAFYGEDGVAPATRIPHTVVSGAELEAAAGGRRAAFLYVGRLERRKGVQNLIRAATALPGADWSLTLVGGDTPTAPLGNSMRDQLELMIGADPRIRMLDRVPREHLRSLYAGAHVCVSPSLWECWPNTVLEAFEQNRPVLATPVGGHLGMVEPRRNGWLAADTSADALLDRMEEIMAARGEPVAMVAAEAPRRSFERLTDPSPCARPTSSSAARRATGDGRCRGAGRIRRWSRSSSRITGWIASSRRRSRRSPHRPTRRSRRSSSTTARARGGRPRARLDGRALSALGRDAGELGARSGAQPRHPAEPRPVRATARPRRRDPAALRRALRRGPRGAPRARLRDRVERVRGRTRAAPRRGGYRPLGNRVAWLERENLAGSAMALFAVACSSAACATAPT